MKARGRRARWLQVAVLTVAVGAVSQGRGLALEAPGTAPGGAAPAAPVGANGAGGSPTPPGSPPPDAAKAQPGGTYFYDHGGRRDPFAPIIQVGPSSRPENINLPPLQRVSVSEINLIGIIWGGFGYTAMVQTPDGKGYTVRQGTRIGPNDGVVSAITEDTVVVREQFSDVYGNKQVREHVKHLHQKQGGE